MTRQAFVLAHRYVGLALAAFLVVAGLTGGLLAFNHDRDAALSPRLFRAPAPSPGARPLDALALCRRLEERVPRVRARDVPLHAEPGLAVRLWASPASEAGRGGAAELENDEFFLDPYTGELLGARKGGRSARA